ncbi:protein Shroom1 [Carcharodon carcharias]|uniref:protein Shroom1 n=1 Tax=Carcharodon carcharias TaxID=13397 RepID=UPI001B7D94A6|nr:protein Shroom1 [Carcharodon carcharias]
MDRLDQKAGTTSHFSPDRLTGHIDQLNHHCSKGDSGYSSFSTSFNAPEYLSLAHCSESPRQSGNVPPNSEALQQTDTKLMSVICDAGVMGTEERPVFLSMENSNSNCHDGKYNWSSPPPPPTRRDSFLVTRQHDGLSNYYSHDGPCPQDMTKRSSIDSKTQGITIESNQQSREIMNLPLKRHPSDLGETYSQTQWCGSTSNAIGFVKNRSLEGSDNFTSKQGQSNPTGSSPSSIHHSSGATLDYRESQQQIYSLPLAQGIKPLSVSHQHVELPPVVTPSSASESNQKAAPYLYITSTYTHTSTRESRPVEGFSGPNLAKGPEKTTEPQKSELDPKFNIAGDCEEGQESLNEVSPRHLVLQSPGLGLQTTYGQFEFRGHNNTSSSQIFYCGPRESSHSPKPHPTMPESAMQSTKKSQRQMRNNIDSAGLQIIPHSDARNNYSVLESHSSRPARQSCTDGVITAENTPMLHRLAFESMNTAKNAAVNAKQKRQLTEGSKEEYKQREGNQDLRRGFQNKMAQLRKCKSSSQLLGESTELNQLNEESPDTSGSSIDSSKIAYRNQVKYAQTKVLRETSFKRRDLQLSWPNRAKQKPTERPSLTHLRTVSLTDPSHSPVDPIITAPLSQVLHEDLQAEALAPQHQTARIGSRKRLTLQEKKMYHSEPEKINQLGVLNSSRKCTPSWEQEKTCNFPNTQGGRSFVDSRRQLFETTSLAANALPVGLKQIQHKALAEYMDRKRSQRPCGTELICDQRQMVKVTQHRRFSEWSNNACPSFSPAKWQNISRHKSAEILWEPRDHSVAVPAHCSNISPESQRFQNRAGDITVSRMFASTDNLLDQPKSVHFVGRPRSKSHIHPLFPQKDSAPGRCSEALKQISSSNNSSFRPFTAKINSVTEPPISYSKCHENECKNLAPSKSSLERPRGKSLNELESSRVKSLSLRSKSSDQLHCTVNHSEPASETGNVESQGRPSGTQTEWNNVALTLKRGPAPPPRLPFPKQNWTKLKREDSKSGTNQVSTTTLSERGSAMVKTHVGSSGAASPSLRSPSPHSGLLSPRRKLGDQAYSHSSMSCWEDDVFLEDFSTTSENNKTDPCIASENISAQFNLARQHPSKAFESSSMEIATNEETKMIPQLTRKNSLPTRESAQMNPRGNGEEHHCRYMPTELGSSPNCSDTNFERPMPTSMAQAAKSVVGKSENGKLFPVKDHQDNREVPTQQLSTDPDTTSVHLRVKTKSPEDLRMEELMKEIIDEDHSLADVLDPSPRRKTIIDLVGELFQKDTMVLEACQRKQMYSQTMEKETKNKDKQGTKFPSSTKVDSQPEISIKINQKQENTKSEVQCPSGVMEKKKELINTIKCKLQKLQEAKASLNEDIKMNSTLGKDIETWVSDVCTTNEIQKYKTFIEDLDKVMNLLLCLSGRLVRVESALSKVNEATDLEEKQSLNERHRMLSRQHEDARGLKEHQDHRERVIFSILTNYLTEKQLQHCQHFFQMKKALLIKQKELEENLRLIEEQLESLENTLQI